MSETLALPDSVETEVGDVSQARAPHMPGELGIWLLVFGEMFEFALFFGVLTYGRLQAPVVFAQSQLALNPTFGLINTVLLLTGSLFVATGIERCRRQNNPRTSKYFSMAIL